MGKDNGELKEYQPLLKDFQEPAQQIKVPSKSLLLAVCAAGIGGTFQYGYNISIINAPTKAVQNFINQTWTERYNTEISTQVLTLLWSTIVSIFTLGGLVGASVGGTLAIRFGRKGTLLFNNTFALLAALFMGLSYPSSTFELLIIGRFLTGVNAGIGICVQPLYIGEIAPRALRGAMAMGTSIFITGGILTGQVIGLNELLDYVFTQAGIPADKIPYATVGTGACECITALTCGLLIESLGRRALIIGGYSLMSVCCVCFTIALTFQESSPWVPYLSMICVFAFILSFGLGPGGVTNILTTELFTQTNRPAAYMIGGSINWIAFFFIGMIFPFIVNGLKQYCFLVFLVICCLVATYIFFVVPETKNKTFLEIQSEFYSKKKLIAANGTEGPLLSTPM
uniref:Solute carrier family 2 member 11b n=1 Tax=Cyprinus carpio TaxID=7962 RepID=A0A8C1MMV0_CYPCA